MEVLVNALRCLEDVEATLEQILRIYKSLVERELKFYGTDRKREEDRQADRDIDKESQRQIQ